MNPIPYTREPITPLPDVRDLGADGWAAWDLAASLLDFSEAQAEVALIAVSSVRQNAQIGSQPL